MRRHNLLIALLFLLPNFLGFVVFTAGPVVFSLGAALTNWNLQRTVPLRFVGLGNFADLFADGQFWLYFANTIYLMLGLPIAIMGSLGLALLLHRKLPAQGLWRTVLYLPSFTSGVAIMILWKALLNPDYGPINTALNGILQGLGIGEAPQWLLSTKNIFGLSVEQFGFSASQFGLGARDALILMGIWTAMGGANMLLYLAALTNVPEELLEAAELDGAGKIASFAHVTWPQLAPTTFFIVVTSIIGGLQGGFEQARVMTAGGPAGATTTLSYYIYSKAFEEFQIGYASAIAWMLFAIVFVATAVQWKFGTRETSWI